MCLSGLNEEAIPVRVIKHFYEKYGSHGLCTDKTLGL